MAKHTPLVQQLIDALGILPSVGPKSAQRMAYQLLERNREWRFGVGAKCWQAAMEQVGSLSAMSHFRAKPRFVLSANTRSGPKPVALRGGQCR